MSWILFLIFIGTLYLLAVFVYTIYRVDQLEQEQKRIIDHIDYLDDHVRQLCAKLTFLERQLSPPVWHWYGKKSHD